MSRKTLILAAVVAAMLIALALAAAKLRGTSALETARLGWEPLGGVPELAAMRPQPVPDEQNAAVLYEQAYELAEPIVRAHVGIDAERHLALTACDEPQLGEVIELAVLAATKPHCVWTSALVEDGFHADMQHLTRARRVGTVLATATECRAKSGDLDDAVRALRAGISLGSNATTSEPSILSALVAASIHNVMLMAMERAFRERELPDEHAIDTALASLDYRAMLRRCLIGETAVGIDEFERLASQIVPGIAVVTGWSLGGDMAHYLNLMRHAIEQLDVPPADRDWSPFHQEPSRRTLLTSMIIPALDRGIDNVFVVETRIMLACEAIRLRENRAVHGEYPELWPMPDDPRTGEPLRYQRDDDGFMLWSEAEAGKNEERIEWRWQ